jgi:hypothetical protein
MTVEDLNQIRNNLNSHYKLGRDIDLSSIANWVPIGTADTADSPFGGNFDGDHYTISNMTIDSSLQHVGLFGYAQSAEAGSSYTSIKNVRLDNVKITSHHPTATVGGLVGEAQAWTSVDRVSVSGTITGVGDSVGGITGVANNQVSNSGAHVRIHGDFDIAGGLAGYGNSNITQSYATGDMTLTGILSMAGGLVGFKAGGRISDSYATGGIKASRDSTIAGLIGFWNSSSPMTNSYALGRLDKPSGGGAIGGLVGDISGFTPSYTITNSYWNETDNPGLTTVGAEPGTGGAVQKSDMKHIATFSGWSSAIWGIQEGISTPYLQTFSPVIKVAPLSPTYYTEPAGNVLQVSGHVRDGSIGEPLTVRIAIQKAASATVTDYVYEYKLPATGDKQDFNWSTVIDDQSYPEGTYTLHVTVEDTVAGQEQQQSIPFQVQDITAPPVPIVTKPNPGQTVGQSKPSFGGTAEAGSTVTIELDGNAAGTTTADAAGNWSWTPSSALTEGGHTVRVWAADTAGNTGALSATRVFTVDTIAPTAAVSSAASGVNAPFSITIAFSEAVQGFTEHDMVIENGSVSNVVTVVTSTTYTAVVSPTTSGQAVKVTLAAGAVMDAAGNANPQSNTLLVPYNTNKPVATFGNFTPGQLFNVPPATIIVSVSEAVYWIAGGAPLHAGNALPLIGMEKDGAAFADYTASFDALANEFTLSFNGAVQDGEYGVLVAGNVVRDVYHNSLDAARASFTIDQTPPAVPALTMSSNGQWTNHNTPTINGTAEVGSTVTIELDGNAAGTTTADAAGNWSWTPSSALPEGGHTVRARAADTAGNTSALSATRVFTVDTIAPTAAVSSAAGGVNAPFSITIAFSEAVQSFTENDMVIENGSVTNVVTVTTTTYSAVVSPTTSGQAVKVTVPAGAVTDAAGNASPQSNTLLVPYNTDKPVATFGNFAPGQLFNVPPATVTVSVPEAMYWIVGGAPLHAGNALPLIGMEKDGVAFTSYTASFDALAHEFTLSFNGAVQDGEYGVLVAGNVVRDVHHNMLDAARASFTIDQTPPGVPTFTMSSNGQWTNNNTPTINGAAEAGAEVTILLDGTVAATVTAAGNGSWTWTPTAALGEGSHTVRVSATDTAGNTGDFSMGHTFTVDTLPPVIALLGDASIVLTAGNISVDPGATVTDLEENMPITITGSVNDQVPGTYTLQYDAQDRAGNVAAPVTRTVQVNARRSTGSGGVHLSNNANLNQLTVRAGAEELAFTPAFAAEATSYRVETTADKVSIEAVASDSKAIVTLGEAAMDGGKTVSLMNGDNVFEIIVKAENGEVKTYSLTIQRHTELAPLPAEGRACTFRDIQGHWAELHICEAFDKGIVEGHSDTAFHPQGLVTRVEFAAMLLRTRGVTSEPAAGKLSFTDQEQIPAWATTTVGVAVEIGVLQGYPDGSLRPMQTVSRSEMAAMLVRVMKWEIEQGQVTSFADDADIPNWAKGYVYAAVERGLLNGRDGNQFSPSEPATRAEAATILLRLWHVVEVMPGQSKE